MKRQRYTIKDELVYNTLHSLADIFNGEGVPYSVVGGIAFQLRMDELGMNESLLRPTGDIDLTLDLPDTEHPLSYLFNHFIMSQRQPDGIINDRNGLRIPDIDGVLYVNATDSPENASKEIRQIYHEIIEESREIEYGDGAVRIPRDIHLITTKLTQRGKREKHMTDLGILIRMLSNKDALPDEAEVKYILKRLPVDYESAISTYSALLDET